MDKKDIKKWFEDIGLVNGLEKMAWVQKEFIEPAVLKAKDEVITDIINWSDKSITELGKSIYPKGERRIIVNIDRLKKVHLTQRK